MPFTKTTWVDGSEPAITAAQLNRIETGVDDAHAGALDANAITPAKTTFMDSNGANAGIYVGYVAANGTAVRLPAGWSSASGATGIYTITHNLGSTSYAIFTNSLDAHVTMRVDTLAANTVQISLANVAGTSTATILQFLLVRY